MLDFNTKKEILKNLRSKRSRNKLMWLPCVIAELFVKLWYAVACSIDMALSDKNGNFLGIRRRSAKPKARRKDDIIHVRKPFWARMLSGVLAASFIVMMLPVIDLSVYAITFHGEEYTKYNDQGNIEYYYKNIDVLNASQAYSTIDEYKIAYGAMWVHWTIPDNGADGYYINCYEKGTRNPVKTQQINDGRSTEAIFSGLANDPNTTYEVEIIPYKNIQLYEYTPAKLPDPNDPDSEGVEESMDPSVNNFFEQKGAVETSSYINVGSLNATMSNPVIISYEYDSDITATLEWAQSQQVTGYPADIGKYADGYVVYQRTVNAETSKVTEYKEVERIENVELNKVTPGQLDSNIYCEVTVQQGMIYEFYILAYRTIFGPQGYREDNVGMITSGNETSVKPTRIATTPTRPKNLKIASNKKDTLTLTWSAGSGSNSGYVIYRSETNLTEEAMAALTPEGKDITANPYYDKETGKLDYGRFIRDKAYEVDYVSSSTKKYPDSDPNLVNDQTYYYYVMAYLITDSSGSMIYGLPISASSSINATLNPPQGLVATPSDGQVALKWDAVAGADGYKIYITKKANNDGTTTGCGTTTVYVTKNSYTHVGLLNKEVYSYQVRAYINSKSSNDTTIEDYDKVLSDFSDARTVTVGEEFGIPQDITVSTSDGQNNIKWAGVKGAEGYELFYQKQGDTGWTKIDLSRTNFTHTRLNNGDTYSYYVKAYKYVNGVKVYSEDSIIVSIMVGDTLDSPKDFTAETDDGVVNLSWSKVKGAEGYILYAFSAGQSYQFDVSKTKYTHSGLENGDIWTYYVVAYKTVNGERFFSDPTKSITVTTGISLNAAVDLIATAGNRQIDLSWSKVNGAEGYVIYLFDEDTQEFEPLTVTSKTKYSHTGLKNGKAYTYMVAPFKTINGERYYGEYSMAVTAIPSSGSNTDIDRVLNIKGTTPYGISHSEYISAKANHDAFEESVDVYFTTNQESTAAVKNVLKNYANGLRSFIIYPFDISVYKENTLIKVDPNDGYTVTVTMPIPDKLIAYRDYLTVVHINENVVEDIEPSEWTELSDQQLEVLPCAILDIDNVWCVQFVCSSFSPYAFVIYKEHLNDVSSDSGIMDGMFGGNFNSGLLLMTAIPDILPNNKKLRVVASRKRYRIKKIEKH